MRGAQRKRRPVMFECLWGVIPAVLIWLAFAIVSTLGWRSDTTFLSGTQGAGGWTQTIERGAAYTSLYVGATLVSPILVIASLLSMAWEARGSRTPKIDQPSV